MTYDVEFTCPRCGRSATATLVEHGDPAGGHPATATFHAPGGCHVDAETVRQIVGAGGT